ncbi:MAG: hypothetical protein R8K21_02035 [Mariprofundales bacterium]
MSISVKKETFEKCLQFASAIQELIHNDAYKYKVGENKIVQGAKCQNSILMGYDFHITNDEPKLIEVNNNAGGIFSVKEGSGAKLLPQPSLPIWDIELRQRLLNMFAPEWHCIAIMDEDIQNQFMLPEMQAFKILLETTGKKVFLVNPEDIQIDVQGFLYVEGCRLDAIYNRHTDFYLSGDVIQHIRIAYLKQTIILTPNPYSYTYLADKTRMRDWWTDGLLESCLPSQDVELIRSIVPRVHMLADMDKEALWKERKHWVFKPTASHAGKGVLLGKATGRKRFAAFDPSRTIVQEYVKPSSVVINDYVYNYDLRLYMYNDKLIAVAGRIWQGMIMNFRTTGSGFVPLVIV